MIRATVPGRLICDDQDVSAPGEYQYLDGRWNVTRGRLYARRLELACPRCGKAHELLLAPAGHVKPAAGELRWDGTILAPTVYGPIVIRPHGACPGWRGRLEGGELRTDAALLKREGGDV